MLKIILKEPDTYQIKLVVPAPTGGNAYVSSGTTASWASREQYIPKNGEYVIYTDGIDVDGVSYPGVKIGDGVSYVGSLPFEYAE